MVILVIRGEALTAAALRTADAWFFEVDHSLAAAIELLYDAAVRSAVRRDRTAYLEFLAAKVASGDMRAPKQLYASVRRAFPLAKSARRQSFHPLPAVKLADGTLALTVQQRIDGWVDHFVQQEGGVRVDDAEYVEAFHSPPIPALSWEKLAFERGAAGRVLELSCLRGAMLLGLVLLGSVVVLGIWGVL
eukprot:s2718_g11.t1